MPGGTETQGARSGRERLPGSATTGLEYFAPVRVTTPPARRGRSLEGVE